MAAPDDDATYFQSFNAYAEAHAADQTEEEPAEAAAPEGRSREPEQPWQDEWERAQESPWSAEDAPHVAEWLSTQQAVLDQISEGVQRDRFWMPYVAPADNDLFIAVTFPQRATSQMAISLRVRAMHRLHANDPAGAIDDVLTIARLSQHMRNQPSVIEQLLRMATASQVVEVTPYLAGHPSLTAEQARSLKDRFSDMIHDFDLTAAFDAGERYVFLDAIQRPWEEEDFHVFSSIIDRNRAMRRANAFYDRVVQAAQIDDRAERRRQLEALAAETERMMDPLSPWWRLPGVLVGSRSAITDTVTDLLAGILMPGFDRAVISADRTKAHAQLVPAALAVAGYRAEHGSYPESLDDLVPAWLDAAPRDIFDPDGGPVRYRLEEQRVVVYSIGENGEDDGGIHDWTDGDIVLEWSR